MPSALVWGVNGGIGGALAAQLAAAGWEVVGVARHETGGPEGLPVVAAADFADDYAVGHAALAAAHHHAEYDLVVYAAGDIAAGKVADMDLLTWQRLVQANLTGPFLTTHHSLPLLAPEGTLVFIGAVQERLRLPGLSAYAAAKAGLEAFVEALGKEERRRKVLLVRPGAVDTPLWTKVPLRLPKGALSPSQLAERIVASLAAGTTGVLDL